MKYISRSRDLLSKVMMGNKMTKEITTMIDPALTDQVSDHYKRFFAKFSEADIIPVNEWKTVHLLAFICKKYETYYGLSYTFKFNHPAPSKSFEVYVIKKIANMISSDPQILKDYIDWVFKSKIIEKKKRITSLNYFAHPDIVNDFKFKFLFNKKEISRTDQLPNNIASICARNGFKIKTYGELAFVKRMPNQDTLLTELQSVGFQIDTLDKIV